MRHCEKVLTLDEVRSFDVAEIEPGKLPLTRVRPPRAERHCLESARPRRVVDR